jgi:hypothetical protein
MSALASAPADPADDLRSAFPVGPVVTVTWRPPSPVAGQELIFDPLEGDAGGVDAVRVVQALCRVSGRWPDDLAFEPDPAARGLSHDNARCYLLDAPDGARLAHVVGISCAWLQVAGRVLAGRGWRPPAREGARA